MKHSTTNQPTESNGSARGPFHPSKWWAALFWLFVWQMGSLALGQEILLVSPAAVLKRLYELAWTAAFWQSVTSSLLRISGGFLLASFCGIILAALASNCRRIRELLAPLMLTIKSVPVASFIILVLIWFSTRSLSVLISFLMVLPVIYTNVLGGIQDSDHQLLEMAKVFDLPARRTIRYILLPQVMPYFRAACSVALGLSWKAGIAAEVIGNPKGSIGEQLYQAKIYLDTPDLFAWTLVIVLVSLLLERLFLLLLDRSARRLEKL